MNHHHTHTHSHTHHVYCLATILYNILVVVAEIILQLFLTAHDIHEVIQFEIKVQLFHIIGVIALGILQWWIMHHIKKQTASIFTGISFFMILVHMIVLHLLPRIWGISVQHSHILEIKEFILLMLIVLGVSVLFWRREYVLEKYGLKNKWHIMIPKMKLF